MGNIDPRYMQGLYNKWNELLNTNEGEKLKKIICIDGKTMRGSKSKNNKAQHIVSAWCDSDGFCLGQKAVNEKTNEITAILQLLNIIMVKGTVITIDAMGAEKIKEKRADYMLIVKENQQNLYNNIKKYFEDDEFLKKMKEAGNYKKTFDKANSQGEIREYYQTDKMA